jgi:hypothetical protein
MARNIIPTYPPEQTNPCPTVTLSGGGTFQATGIISPGTGDQTVINTGKVNGSLQGFGGQANTVHTDYVTFDATTGTNAYGITFGNIPQTMLGNKAALTIGCIPTGENGITLTYMIQLSARLHAPPAAPPAGAPAGPADQKRQRGDKR